jgi:hypothetical protein
MVRSVTVFTTFYFTTTFNNTFKNRKKYGKVSHSFYYFLFLPTNSITVLRMEKKCGKVSHNKFSIINNIS